LGVLGDAVAKRPVFFFDFDQIDEDILCPDAKGSMEPPRDLLVQALFASRVRPSFNVIWITMMSSVRSISRKVGS
jgi:hypothetical protein